LRKFRFKILSYFVYMDANARLHLQEMVKANNVEDQTELIRELKHSHLLQEDINNLIMIKAKNRNDEEKVHQLGMEECSCLLIILTFTIK